ncbi:MAG: GSCFA domain-containing protein [Rhizobiales bacterium]|nr:GSCFA domain-containing protein [Hyphomicrobiales bacterium]MBI3674808.1 GSCFA domain-containing protein [Hyphomicrobiales bacterium]
MSGKHPYQSLPGRAFWRRSMSEVTAAAVDPVSEVKFRIEKDDKIVTAGSCFAQHIAKRLKADGFSFLVTESGHPLLSPEDAKTMNYGVFSARYGNIYSSRQFLQLLKRIDGSLVPVEDVWEGDGRWIDPFRPQIQPDGFHSLAAYRKDRDKHFAAVRRAFAEMDVFVFTLGLTEIWRDRRDGSVYPLAPGVAGGRFDPAIHEFVNLGVSEVVDEMTEALALIREINPHCRVILTVSPVPLMATASGRHVLAATTYSKAVLRVAAEELSADDAAICYFPSYEIITGNHARGAYFGADGRSVTNRGVDHVMRLFFKHFSGLERTVATEAKMAAADRHSAEMEELAQANCDEEALDRG